MSRKQELKKLKGPDQFQVKAMESVDWLTKHGRELTIVAVLAALGVGGVAGYQMWNQGKRDARLESLGEIDVAFSQEEEAAEKQREDLRSQIEGIEAQIADAKNATQKPEGESAEGATRNEAAKEAVDTTALEIRKKELQDQIEAIEPDNTKSRQQYADFYNKHAATPEGWAAGTRAASLLLKNGELNPAKEILTGIVKNTNNYIYQTQSRLILSGVHEDLGSYDEGLALVNEAEKIAEKDEDLKPQILFAKGRLLYLKDAKDDARKVFDEIITSYGSSAEADKARSMKFLLN